MKIYIQKITMLLVLSLVAISCDYDETNFDALTKDYTGNSSYYLQFSNASRSLQSGVKLDGSLDDIETTIDVVLLGPPQSQDITVDLNIDPSSTLEPEMYELSSTSVTIPAGETSGSVSLTTNTEEMPEDQPLNLKVTLDAGENTATAGTDLNYELLRIRFCPLENGAADFVGNYSVEENTSGWENDISISLDSENNVIVSDMAVDIIEAGWGEPIIADGTFKMEFTENGMVTIPRQYIYTTTWEGAPYRYEIEGSGTWSNCDGTTKLDLSYDIYYEGESAGLGESYYGVSSFGGVFAN